MTSRSALARAVGCEPAVVEWVAVIEEISAALPDLRSADPARQRWAASALADAVAIRFTLPGPADCTVTEHRMPTRAGEVTVLHYRPAGDDRPRPVHLWIHGGGFVHGGVHDVVEDRLLRRRAVDSGFDIVAVDYRLAPEHPFPAGLQDCIDVLDGLAAKAGDLGIDAGRIGIGGSSAGGNLAALVAVHARDSGGPALDHQVLEVPAASLHIEQDASYRAYGELEAGSDLAGVRAAYLGVAATGWAAPAEVPDLAGLPPALVVTAECDPLRDSGQAYAARLAAAGVAVESWCAPGQAHGSAQITRTSATARKWQDRVSSFLQARADLTTTATS